MIRWISKRFASREKMRAFFIIASGMIPGTQLDPMFVERMERYDVFGRPLSRG